MTVNSKTTLSAGGELANTNRQTAIKESKMKITTQKVIRLAGLSAMLAGVCFLVIGMFHPVNVLSSVTSATWVNVHISATALGFFGLLGLAGLYARQVEETGWLGLAGFLLFGAWMTLVGGMSLVEAFILPRLTTEFPAYVTGIMGMFSSIPSQVDLGALPTLWIIQSSLVYPWTPAVWHRYVPRPRPSSLGRCFADPRNRADPRRCSSSARDAAEDHAAGGTGDGMAGIRPLFRTASVSPGTRTLRGKPPAQPTRSRVSSLEATWSGQAADRPLVPPLSPTNHHR